MTRHTPETKRQWAMRKLKQYWPVIPLAAILFALMLSDLDVMGYSPFSEDPCALTEIDQNTVSARMYQPLAGWALHSAKNPPSPRVALVYIDPKTEPASLLTNTCDSRAFLARLIGALNRLGASVIAIDKYYSDDACSDAAKNAQFTDAVETSDAPVVLGQPTHLHGEASKVAGCLALSKHLDFKPGAKVFYGLTRLNNDTLSIPLRWPIFSETEKDAAGNPKPLPDEQTDGLSLVAAKAEDANIERGNLAKMLAAGTQPYTTFLELPHINATVAICSAEAAPSGTDPCAPSRKPVDNLDGGNLNLRGKVVMVGDLSDQDMQPYPGGERPGVFLQANYVQSILDGRFLQQIPLGLTLGFLVVFVIGVYCLYWAHDAHGTPRLTAEQAGLGSLGILLALTLLSLLALVTMNYFTPLWALWGALVFLVFRYLEASGHHRSQHLMGQLAGHGENSAENEAPHDKP